jgi:enterochelin esterase-like enzyme
MRTPSVPAWLVSFIVITALVGVGVIVIMSWRPWAPRGPGDQLRLVLEQTAIDPMRADAPQPVAGSNMLRPERLAAGFTIVVRDASGQLPSDAQLFIACNRNAWNPADPAWRLKFDAGDGTWSLALPGERVAQPASEPDAPAWARDPYRPFEFKLTLGSWDRVETDAGGFSIRNRTLPLVAREVQEQGVRPIFSFKAERFLRMGEVENLGRGWTPPVAGGRVQLVTVQGGGGRASGLTRDLFVWLPPGYDDPANAQRRYPVLIVLDGQSAFAISGASPAEMRLDEAAVATIHEGKVEPLIIVGVPHAGSWRFDEYWVARNTPQQLAQGPFAEALRATRPDFGGFQRFMIEQVVPAVQRSARTRPPGADWGIGGMELSGAAGFALATQNRGVFGKCFSDGSSLWRLARELMVGKDLPAELVISFGDQISDFQRPIFAAPKEWVQSWVDEGEQIRSLAATQPKRFLLNFRAGTDDSERGLGERLPDTLAFLYPPASGAPNTAATPKPSAE